VQHSRSIKARDFLAPPDGGPKTPPPKQKRSTSVLSNERRSWVSLVRGANSEAVGVVSSAGTSPGGSSSSNTVIGDEDCVFGSPRSFSEKKVEVKMSGDDPSDTGDLAFFLRTTGPPMTSPSVADEHRERKLRRLVALGKFRKRGEGFADTGKEE
jgi:hypothetical protein